MAAPRPSHRFLTGFAAAALAWLGALVATAALLPVAEARASDAEWVVVVHPANPVRQMKRSDLERAWRRRMAFWPDGTAVVPLNLPGGEPLRESFQQKVLHSDDEELTQWWNRAYFQGVSPPVVLQSGAAVKAYVAVTPGAVGYIPASLADSTVAAVEVDLDH